MIEYHVRQRERARAEIDNDVQRFIESGAAIEVIPAHEVSEHRGGFSFNNQPRGNSNGS